jgi:DNA replication protein DnaC
MEAELADEQRRERERKLRRLFDDTRLGERFKESTFEQWVSMPGTQKAFSEAVAMVDQWNERRETGQGLILYGPPGNGKSHLAASIINGLVSKGVLGVFLSVPELMDRIRYTYDTQNNETESAILAGLDSADLLILDDAGAERWSEWVESKLFRIIDTRYRKRKPIIVTTNLDLKALGQAVGLRSMDRLIEMCTVVELTGKSYRRLQAEQRYRERGA